MEQLWLLILISTTFAAALLLFSSRKPTATQLPPSPPTVPLIGNLLLLRKFQNIGSVLRNLYAKLGPVITLHIFSRPIIFIADGSLAHQSLVQNGAVFAGRPKPKGLRKIISCDQHNISFATYGTTWRTLRRNLTAGILHPSRVRSYAHARKWVFQILIDRLNSQSKTADDDDSVPVVDHFQYAMFCLLVVMCFGDKLEQKQIEQIQKVQRRLLLGFGLLSVLNIWPRFTKIIFRNRWKEFLKCHQDQKEVLVPLIRARSEVKTEKSNDGGDYGLAYVDTLLDLDLPDENRKLEEPEIVSLCSEFLNGGTDTTSTALQWIFANMVKYPEIQTKLFDEIRKVMGDSEEEVKEEDLHRIPYLKSVVLEALRRHPPGHFLLPHTTTEEAVVGGYTVPKGTTVNFSVAEMGWDPKVWEDPMEFRPERFTDGGGGEGFDITGSREIKMMPFGVGRRICPGLGLAILHLEYFVANLVLRFEWRRVEGDELSMEEKLQFTTVMKTPLKAMISARRKDGP